MGALNSLLTVRAHASLNSKKNFVDFRRESCNFFRKILKENIITNSIEENLHNFIFLQRLRRFLLISNSCKQSKESEILRFESDS